MMPTHSFYAVHFSDSRIKVGVTADIAKRIGYYTQESRRNRCQHLTWWSSAPAEKRLAYMIERFFCRGMREVSIPHHREWFEGDTKAYASVVAALEVYRADVALPTENMEDLAFLGRHGHVVTGHYR